MFLHVYKSLKIYNGLQGSGRSVNVCLDYTCLGYIHIDLMQLDIPGLIYHIRLEQGSNLWPAGHQLHIKIILVSIFVSIKFWIVKIIWYIVIPICVPGRQGTIYKIKIHQGRPQVLRYHMWAVKLPGPSCPSYQIYTNKPVSYLKVCRVLRVPYIHF
jgi:hypothetical protein